MHVIEEIELNGVVCFKKAKAQINKNGLTFVRGVNLDADPVNPTGNGVGKSLFFSTLPNVYYFSPPLAIKKKAKKELLGNRGSTIRVKQRHPDGNVYDITQGSSKYIIKKNGEDLQLRTVPLSEAFIRDIFPLSEVEFYTSCYVSTQKLYPFQNDSNLARLEHLVSVFGLDNYDLLKKHFMEQLRDVKDLEVKLSVLEQRRMVLKDDIKKAGESFDEEALRKLKAEIKDLGRQVKAHQAHEHDLNVQVRDLKTLLTIQKELDTLRAKYDRKEHPKDAMPILKADLKVLRTWEKYKGLFKVYTRSKDSLEAKLSEITLPNDTRKNLTAQLESLASDEDIQTKQLLTLERTKEDYDEAKSKVNRAKILLTDLGFVSGDANHFQDAKELDEALSQCKTTLNLQKLLEHEDHEGKCPTCLSEIDLDNIRKSVKSAAKQLPLLLKQQKIHDAYRDFQKASKALKSIQYDSEALDSMTKKFRTTKKSRQSVESGLESIKTHDGIKSQIAALERPVKVDQPNTDKTEEELEALIDLCAEIMQHIATREKILSHNEVLAEYKSAKSVDKAIKDLDDDLETAQEDYRKSRELLAVQTTRLEKLTGAQSELLLYREEYRKVRKEIAQVKPKMEHKQVLETLIKAYGAKGLRTIAANKICSLLESNLNHYRSLVFSEPFTFTVGADESGMSIIADRGNNHLSDVRQLSGAESNCFRLLFVLAILPLIPSDRRLNMLVLDEPTSHMDSITRVIFRERYLPTLREVVPNIFVISPHLDDHAPESNEWLVQKHKGVSRLITSASMGAATSMKRKALQAA